MMNDPVAQPFFAVLDVSPRDMQRLGSRPIDRKLDQLGRLICRLAPIARKLAGEIGPLCLVDQAPPYLVAGGDKWKAMILFRRSSK